MYNYTVMRQVPPRIVKFDYTEPPSTTTIAVYIYGRQDRNNKYPDNVCNSSVDPVDVKYLYRRPRTSTKTCTTTVAVYHYAQVPLQDVPLPSPKTVKCTTTAAVDSTRQRVPLLPRRPVNAYFLYTAPNSNRSKNARFKGITRHDRDEMALHV